jgi:hypothetical protein
MGDTKDEAEWRAEFERFGGVAGIVATLITLIAIIKGWLG